MSTRLEGLLKHREHIRNRMCKMAITDPYKAEPFRYATLRVGAITFNGLAENRLLNRAAALSFSSLIGLIPMTAIMILVSGFVLQKSDPDIVVKQIYRGLSFIAPQIASLEEQSNDLAQKEGGRAQLKEYLLSFVEASQSGVVGISGMIMLMLIVIQLFSSIEGALSDI